MAKVQKAILTEYTNDGSVVMSNIRKGKADLPVIGSNETYSATLVTEWYDGSPMDDSKADGAVYLKYKGTEYPNYTGSYFRVNLPNWGETFLQKPNVDSLRNMSSTEILLLRVGYYKGVNLLGYYAENGGDTPAPIEYYLSDTTESDDGGSVFEVRDVKLEHDFKGYIHASYFGVVGDGVTDDSVSATNAANKLSQGGTLEFYSNKIYRMMLDINKSIIVQGNGSTFTNVSATGTIIRMQGNMDKEFTQLEEVANYGDSHITIPISEASTLSQGDILVLSDAKTRSSGANAEVNNEIIKVREVVGNQVYVYDFIRSYQTEAPMQVWKVNTIKSPKIFNVNIECNSFNSGFPIQILYAENVVVENCSINRNQLMGLSTRYSYGVTYRALRFSYGVNRETGGMAYGAACNTCRDILIQDIQGIRMRHTVDLSACYVGTVRDCIFKESYLTEVALAHNTYGGCFTVDNIEQDGGLGVVGWGDLADEGRNYIIQDVNINNIRHTVTRYSYDNTNDNRIRTVFLGASVGNVNISNVKFEWHGQDIIFTNEHRVIRVYGIPTKKLTLSNIYANKCGDMISFGGNVVTVPNLPPQGFLIVNNIYADQVNNMFYLGGVGKVIVDGLYYEGDSGNIFQLTQLGGQRHTKYLKVSNIEVKSTVTMFEKTALYNTNLLAGGVEKKVVETNIYSISEADFQLTEAEVLGQEDIILDNTSEEPLRLGVNFLPTPTFINQEINITATSSNSIINPLFNFNTADSSIISSYNPRIGLSKDKSYKLKAVVSGGVLRWLVTSNDSVANDGFDYNVSPSRLVGRSNASGISSKIINNQGYWTFNSSILSSSFVITKYASENNLSVLTFNSDGTLASNLKLVSTDTVATTTTKGIVNQATAVPDGSSVDDLLAALRTAGIIAT